VDCFARAARCGKNFMQQVHRCQKVSFLTFYLFQFILVCLVYDIDN